LAAFVSGIEVEISNDLIYDELKAEIDNALVSF